MPQPRTRPGTRKLSDVARHLVLPDGIVSSGWPSVRDKCLDLGVQFDDWQHGLGRAALAKRADGRYAAGVGGVVFSIPRQIGKTYTVGAIVFALCILFPGLTVVWTAHRTRTAGETFRSMQGMARRRKVAPFIEDVFRGSGDEEVRFRNGSRILFGARERGFGRGFAEVDVEVFDEAQILTDRALDDMVPATNQSKQPTGALLFFIGTPPRPIDPGEAFTAKRAKALAGKSKDMLYVELSADEGADPDDRKQWAKANPSFPKRTPVEAMLRMQENLTPESFLREGLGIWDDKTGSTVIPLSKWDGCFDVESVAGKDRDFAIDVSIDRARSSISVASQRPDGLVHVEVIDNDLGTEWVVDRCVALKKKFRRRCTFTLDAGGPAGGLLAGLVAAGVDVESASLRNHQQACGGIYDAVTNGQIRHRNQEQLRAALVGAKKRKVGDAWLWDRKTSTVDITPLVATTLAVWANAQRAAGAPRVVNLAEVLARAEAEDA